MVRVKQAQDSSIGVDDLVKKKTGSRAQGRKISRIRSQVDFSLGFISYTYPLMGGGGGVF